MTASRRRRKKLRILVSNDDGIHAPGLAVAEKIARTLSDDIWVVAPETEQSGASHSLTLSMPLRLRNAGPQRFAVSGTPTDCVMMAGIHILKDDLPDLVLSGVNRGFNVADDVTYSGTVAAAMEGAVLGIPSIALSQAVGGRDETEAIWACAAKHGPPLVKRLVEIGWAKDVLLNVNFPALPPSKVRRVAVVAQGQRDQSVLRVDERVDARGRTYFWIGFKRIFSDPQPGTDLRAMFEGQISVTALHLNLTELKEHQRLHAMLDGPLSALNSRPRKRNATTGKPAPAPEDEPQVRMRRADTD
jgi:5'-nucleotidase